MFGLILLVGTPVLLFWNEGRSVKRYQALKEGAGTVVEIGSDRVDPANEGRLVHLSGDLATAGPVEDAEFGISVDAIHLTRKVETFQWIEDVKKETRERLGGGSETVETFSYRRDWREGIIDSSRFYEPQGHQNPREARFPPATRTAEDVTLGAFRLPSFLVAKVGGSEPLPVADLEGASEAVRESGIVRGGGVVYFGTADTPQVGDTRVSFQVVRPGPVSVVAQQQGDSFTRFRARSGVDVDLLYLGVVSAAEMFERAQAENRLLTWGIRGVGFVLLGIGFSLIFGPLGVIAGILPIFGRIVRAGTTAVSFLLAGIVWSVVVAVAWIFYRPVLGVIILLLAAALLVLLVKRLRAGRDAGGAPATAVPGA